MKTIEEARQDANDCILPKSAYEFDRGFDAGVEFAQRWIPVEEELPEVGFLVLTRSLEKLHRLAFHTGEFWMNNKGVAVLNITHWRPIELK